MIQCEVVRSNIGWLTSIKPSLQVTWNFNWTSMKPLNTAQQLGEESDKSRDYWTMHQHHCSCAGVTDPPIPLFCRITMNSPLRVSMGLSSHRQVSWGCYRDHKPWEDSLRMLHPLGNNRDGMLGRGKQLYSHEISLFGH
jgi:hypothetical protein